MSKSLLQRLRDSGLIKTEKREIQREREKVGGFMWGGKLEITLKDGRVFKFKLWQNINGDVGNPEWEPKDEDLHFYPQFIPIDGGSFDYTWHAIFVDNLCYGTKSGFFDCDGDEERHNKRKEMEEKIRDGSWKEDPDIHFII